MSNGMREKASAQRSPSSVIYSTTGSTDKALPCTAPFSSRGIARRTGTRDLLCPFLSPKKSSVAGVATNASFEYPQFSYGGENSRELQLNYGQPVESHDESQAASADNGIKSASASRASGIAVEHVIEVELSPRL